MSGSTLYNSICYALRPDVATNIKFVPERPLAFKKLLGLGYNDELGFVTDEQIATLERKLRLNIVVNDRQSASKHTRTISLKFYQGKYSFVPLKHITKALFCFRDHNRQLKYYQLEGTTVTTFDGHNTVVYPNFKKKWFVEDKDFSYKQIPSNKNIVFVYDKYLLDCAHLKHISGIDLSKTDWSVKSMALNLFYSYARVFDFPPISREETQWITKTKRCGLMYCEPSMGEMNSYDVNSQYPFIMCSKDGLPQGVPVFETIVKPTSVWRFGIYRVRITGADRRLFLYNRLNFYTHLDVKRALQLGANVCMIDDGKPNAMLYAKRVPANQLFGPYVAELFQHKNTINKATGKKNPLIKNLLNILCGALAEKHTVIVDDDEDVDTGDAESVEIIRDYDGDEKVKMTYGFLRPHARIYPYITGYGRSMISKICEPIIDDVYKIHTDGFLTTVDELPVSSEMGDLKLDGSGHYNIFHLNKVQCLPFLNELELSFY